MMRVEIAIVGAGAAGLFLAAELARRGRGSSCQLLERSRRVGSKILLSGGGRCNFTHACFNVRELAQAYSRGSQELLGPLKRFGPQEVIAWFREAGVIHKVEEDGRIFPSSDRAQTILDALLSCALTGGVTLEMETAVEKVSRDDDGFLLHKMQGPPLHAKKLVLATGSHPSGLTLAHDLGLPWVDAVPSLFSFHLAEPWLTEEAGASCEVVVSLEGMPWQEQGALLITHLGVSGPAILKLSSRAARALHAEKYQACLRVDWLPSLALDDLHSRLLKIKTAYPSWPMIRALKESYEGPWTLTKGLFKALISQEPLPLQEIAIGRWSDRHLYGWLKRLKYYPLRLVGQSLHKQEFVTAGGVELKEINFKRFESRHCPGLFMAGELLNIDAITGGFNFQAAWTGAWHIAEALSADQPS